jgi:rhamnulokinase
MGCRLHVREADIKTKNYFAVDFGASTGRGILGRFNGNKLTLEAVDRFPNFFVDLNGTCYWDVLYLLNKIQEMLRLAEKQLAGRSLGTSRFLVSFGLDTWGTDYGLLDKNGQLLGNVRCMRNADGCGAHAVVKKIGPERLFDRTGLQIIYGNTLFQLYERLVCGDGALQSASRLMMLPDLLAYFLTGVVQSEYTISTTSMMYNPTLRSWDFEILKELGIPAGLLPAIQLPCQQQLPLREAIYKETGFKQLRYVPVATHDTASAVAAIPLGTDEAFCSSGTWSILGIENEEALLAPEVRRANFSSEGTINGKYRPLKNIMGMWLIQQCAYEWEYAGNKIDWEEIVQQAAAAPAFCSFVDTEHPSFYNVGGMIDKIQNHCRESGQAVPKSVGEIARCIYENIVMRYRVTVEQLEQLRGRPIKALRIVGGGCQNGLVNQMTADALNRPVYAGPVEAACIGNLLAQGIPDGEVAGMEQLREVVRHSFIIDTYEPKNAAEWDEAYGRYTSLIEMMRKKEETPIARR